MIKSLFVKNFKSIDEYNFSLKKINLLVGPNSSGKSSVIRALLLGVDNLYFPQNSHKMTSTFVPSLSFRNARNFVTNAKFFQVKIDDADLIFKPSDDFLINTNVEVTLLAENGQLTSLKRNFLYLPANRTIEYSGSGINPRPDENVLGQHGEFIVDYFQQYKDNTKLPELIKANRITNTFGDCVNYWLKKLTGYTMEVIFEDSKYVVRYIDRNLRKIQPNNVGTGVSFVAGVLIACLAGALNEGYIVIENPEIHLHPSAQADLIDFLSLISQTGAQLFIESHSDHLFNGIRRLLHQKKLQLSNVGVFNFRLETCGSTSIKEIELSQEGGITNYEPDLFEQFDKDLDSILS